MPRSIPTRGIGALRDSELYGAILGLTPPWTLANGEPNGRKKTTIALSTRSESIRVLLELDRLALRQREQFDLVRACGCAAIPVPYPAPGVARGCRTSIAQPTSRRSPSHCGHAVRAWSRRPWVSCRVRRTWTGAAGPAT